MGILTEDMKRVVREQRLGFVATVCPDGTPNLSPKGTTTVWDDNHLVFAHICSPGTIANLQQNPAVEINVVDPVLRKGYRFKGVAMILTEGPVYAAIRSAYGKGPHPLQEAVDRRIEALVLVRVQRALPLISPVYEIGATEAEVAENWQAYWDLLRRTPSPR